MVSKNCFGGQIGSVLMCCFHIIIFLLRAGPYAKEETKEVEKSTNVITSTIQTEQQVVQPQPIPAIHVDPPPPPYYYHPIANDGDLGSPTEAYVLSDTPPPPSCLSDPATARESESPQMSTTRSNSRKRKSPAETGESSFQSRRKSSRLVGQVTPTTSSSPPLDDLIPPTATKKGDPLSSATSIADSHSGRSTPSQSASQVCIIIFFFFFFKYTIFPTYFLSGLFYIRPISHFFKSVFSLYGVRSAV